MSKATKAVKGSTGLSKQDMTDIVTTVVGTLQGTGLVGSHSNSNVVDDEMQVIADARKTIIQRVAKVGPCFKVMKQGKYKRTINVDAVAMKMVNAMDQDKDPWT